MADCLGPSMAVCVMCNPLYVPTGACCVHIVAIDVMVCDKMGCNSLTFRKVVTLP